jgi:hypothetical protein
MVTIVAVLCAVCVEAKAVVSVMYEFHGYCVLCVWYVSRQKKQLSIEHII